MHQLNCGCTYLFPSRHSSILIIPKFYLRNSLLKFQKWPNWWIKEVFDTITQPRASETSNFLLYSFDKCHSLFRVEFMLGHLSNSNVYKIRNTRAARKIARTESEGEENGKQRRSRLHWDMRTVAVDEQVFPEQIGRKAGMVGSGENTATEWSQMCRMRWRTNVSMSSKQISTKGQWWVPTKWSSNLPLLQQVYAPLDEYEHCFHRTIYVFICTNTSCWHPNTAR